MTTYTEADLGGGCRGCAPPPEMTWGFLIQLIFYKKKNFVVYWRWSRARDECTPSWKTSWIRPWYTQIFCHMWKLRVTDLWCGGFWQVKHWENNCFKLVFLHEYASVMNHCICLSFHMLSLKVFENCFPFNRVLSFLVSENLTSCRLNKYFSTACKESSVQ